MSLESIGNDLLKEHNELYFELIKIPEDRELDFHIENQNGNQIGRPRFKHPLYSWPSVMITRFHNHLANLAFFLNTYSYWFDDIIASIITIDDKQIDKNSLIYLLQQDVDKIDEVYADYLIEKRLSIYTISYYRGSKKKRTFQPNINSQIELEKWVCLDARKQIIDQFTFLWTYLQDKIEQSIKQDSTRLPSKIHPQEYIIKQNRKIRAVVDQYPDLAMLNLGRIAELYLLQILQINKPMNQINLAWMAKNKGLLTNQQTKLFDSIREEYNALNNHLDYSVARAKIERLWNDFSSMINS